MVPVLRVLELAVAYVRRDHDGEHVDDEEARAARIVSLRADDGGFARRAFEMGWDASGSRKRGRGMALAEAGAETRSLRKPSFKCGVDVFAHYVFASTR